MLAHVFKDDKGKIKTAPKGFPQAPNGWFVSEKFDGYRAGTVKISDQEIIKSLKLQGGLRIGSLM